MTKQWLMRRAVRRPVSRATTAPISSSVCRLPFISASAVPARTSSTALAAESWLCAASTISKRADVEARPWPRPRGCAPAGRPGSAAIRPSRAASTAPSSETSSHGCATAVADRRVLCGGLDQPLVLLVRGVLRARWRPSGTVASPCVGGSAPARRTAPRPAPDGARPSSGSAPRAPSTLLHGLQRRAPRAPRRRAAAAGWRAPRAPRRGAAAGTGRGTSSLSSAEAEPALRPAACARIACSDGEAALVDAALRQPDVDQRADHRLGQAARLEALLEVGLRIAASIASRSESRSMRRCVGAARRRSPTTACSSGEP